MHNLLHTNTEPDNFQLSELEMDFEKAMEEFEELSSRFALLTDWLASERARLEDEAAAEVEEEEAPPLPPKREAHIPFPREASPQPADFAEGVAEEEEEDVSGHGHAHAAGDVEDEHEHDVKDKEK